MKLTRLQRHAAYILMLVECDIILKNISAEVETRYYKGGTIQGLCELFCHLFDADSVLLEVLDVFGLTEIQLKRPDSFSCYWFSNTVDGWEKRKIILEKCIEETY